MRGGDAPPAPRAQKDPTMPLPTGSASDAALARALERCAEEPIHQIGGIQPHGALLVVDPRTDLVTHASANMADWLDSPPEGVIGSVWTRWLTLARGTCLQTFLASTADRGPATLLARVTRADGSTDELLMTATLRARLFLELTRVEPADAPLGPSLARFHDAARPVFESSTLDEQNETLATFVRDLLGFDRVKVYRFDANWNGTVVAESNNGRMESYLGLRFPASDVPAQARRLYARSSVRYVGDVATAPVPVLPVCDSARDEPLDLSECGLRAVAPVHLQYLRNMGVASSLSISLMHEGELWGLVACHNATPRHVSAETMQVARVIGSLASSQLSLRHEKELLERRSTLAEAVSTVRTATTVLNGMPEPIWAELQRFGEGIGAPHAFVNLHNHARCTPAPGLDELGALVQAYLETHAGNEAIFCSTSLPSICEEALPFRAIACGLIAIRIGIDWKNAVLFFRPEQEATVTWAGRIDATGGKHIGPDGSLNPRASFAAWSERASLTSRAFLPSEISAAADLRRELTDIVINASERELTRTIAELTARNSEMEEFVYSISHDLQSPIVTIDGFLHHTVGAVDKDDHDAALRYLSHIQDASVQMRSIIMDLLEVSRVGRVDLATEAVPLGAAIHRACEHTRLRYEEAMPFEIVVEGDFGTVSAHPTRIGQVFDNLLGNAVKYGLTDEERVIRVIGSVSEGGTEVRVRDFGPGIPAKFADKAFQLFARLTTEETPGNGIGLTLVRRIMGMLGGTVRLDNGVERGAEFVLTFPVAGNVQHDGGGPVANVPVGETPREPSVRESDQ